MDNMNDKQRKVLIAAGVLLVIMIMFPPYTATAKDVTFNGGYAFILIGPSDQGQFNGLFHVDVALLFLQWLFVVAIAAIAWFLLKEKAN